MRNRNDQAPAGATDQNAAEQRQELRIDELPPADAAAEQTDALRGGVIDRGNSTGCIQPDWTNFLADSR